jgi:tRNA G18 (ribose-2'-O)-methylase SpoU
MRSSRERRVRDHRSSDEGTDLSLSPAEGGTQSILLGDDIENPGNADCLRVAAAMFDWECGFLCDPRRLAAQATAGLAGARLVSREELAACGAPVIAIENAAGAEDLFRFRPPQGRLIVVVGNERKGIARNVMHLASRTIQIPMASAHLNTVNVAAAAAIALYHLSRAGGGRLSVRGGHRRSRPELLLVGPSNPIELGSAVRSAACFGWTRLFLDDRHGAWFAADRVTRSLGRGAARRGRNAIRVIPARAGGSFEEVCVVSAQGEGQPLRHADLALGPGQLVVLPDESCVDLADHELARLGRHVRRVRLELADVPRRPFRLTASIALAEIARQVGGLRRPGEPRAR